MTCAVRVNASCAIVKTGPRLMLQEKICAQVVTDLSNQPKAIVTSDDFLCFIVEVESPPDRASDPRSGADELVTYPHFRNSS